jgi:glucokinase
MQKPRSNALPVLAVDLGSTKILTALISSTGKVIAKNHTYTLANMGAKSVINRMLNAIDCLLNQEDIRPPQLDSISIAAAGSIDMKLGVVTISPQIPGWHNIPLKKVVQEKFGIRTYLINDASAAVLSEHQLGSGMGIDNLIYITVSTGIGSGIIVNGEICFGANGSAGELGHMTISTMGPACNCGNIGCLQTLASGTALVEDATKRITRGDCSSLRNFTENGSKKITAEQIEIAARSGDSLSKEVILKAATYLGIGMVNLIHIFNPEMIIIGGGLSNMGDLLLDPARQIIKERAHTLSGEAVRIVISKLMGDAGIFGAAIFARSQCNGQGVLYESS